jgi:oxygen-dependent protoporphyrinogen oxidase
MPLSVIITTFKKENVQRPLEGFGVLVPSKEQQNGLKTLGNALSLLSTSEYLISFFYVTVCILVYRYTLFFYDVSRSCT